MQWRPLCEALHLGGDNGVMIFWEVPGEPLPAWSAAQNGTSTTHQTTDGHTDSPGDSYAGATDSAEDYTEYTESGMSEDANGTTASGSSSWSFSQTFSADFTFTKTERVFDAGVGRVRYRTRSETSSSSSSSSHSFSYSFAGTTETDASGTSITTMTASSVDSSSRADWDQGSTTESQLYFWTTSDGDGHGALITQGTEIYGTEGPYSAAGDTATGTSTEESTSYPTEGGGGGGRQTTHLTTGEVTGSTWETYEDTTTVLTTDASGTATTTSTVGWRSTVETTFAVTGVPELTTTTGDWPANVATETRVVAERCHQLYQAGEHDALAHWCDVWTPVAVGSLVPSYSEQTITEEPYTYLLEEEGYSVGQSSQGGITTFERVSAEFTVAAGPTPMGGMIIRSPAANGFQHYNSLAPDDPVFATFTIHLPTTVTDTAESTARKFGRRVMRGNITQVVTLNAEDSLSMGAAVSTFAGGGDAGGYGLMNGLNTITWQRGIYNFTYHQDGSSSSGRRTETTSVTEISPRGRVWHVTPQSVDLGGLWNDSPIIHMELPCSLPES